MSDVFETMHTTRAMRRLKPDPVPDALIARILRAGASAANGGNTQRWRLCSQEGLRLPDVESVRFLERACVRESEVLELKLGAVFYKLHTDFSSRCV